MIFLYNSFVCSLIKYGIYCKKQLKQFPCSLFVLLTTASFATFGDVVRSTNKDEDIRYKDRVHTKLQEKNNEIVG